jgi:hypothetical protein
MAEQSRALAKKKPRASSALPLAHDRPLHGVCYVAPMSITVAASGVQGPSESAQGRRS